VHHQHATTTTFTQTNLISDGSVPAQQTDPNLINPWGVSYSPTSPFWISENGTGLASIDSVTASGVTVNVASISPVTIAPPTPDSGPTAPTGQVFNAFASSGAFTLQDGSPATFLFATEDGTISGWNPAAGSQSIIAVNEAADPADGSEALGLGAVYKGLAIAQTDDGPMLYAANGTVDMFDQNFDQVKSFTDPNLPSGFAPFDVQVLGDKLFVTFALQDDMKHDDVAGAGNGFVDEFDLEGHLLKSVASGDQGDPLNSPWGLAIAPSSFGSFAGDLLVGNFGDGTIDAFDLKHHDKFVGQLTDASGNPIVIPDLWELIPGNGGSAGDANTIFFTAGLQDEMQGLFGSLRANPTPSPAAMTGTGSHHMTG
jgi:uncharacterized protein (TIGR03118 family)